jgi:hypothetical protein
MRRLYRCLAVAGLLLWTDHIAGAQEDQYAPPLPEEIPEDVDGAMAKIGEVLKAMGVRALESVVVAGITDKGEDSQVAFANKVKRDAAAQAPTCDVPARAPDARNPADPQAGENCDPRLAPGAGGAACQLALPALLVPKCDAAGNLIQWYAAFDDPANKPYKLKYIGSPGTSLDCGNRHGGRRTCRQY